MIMQQWHASETTPPVFDRLQYANTEGHTVSDQILEVGTAWERG